MTESFAGIGFSLPARPGVLAELSAELEAYDPDFRKVSALVNNDLGLAATVVKTANSPYFGVSGRIVSIQQAINFLGLSQVFSLVTGAMLRRVFPEKDPLMDALWDISAKRAALMARLARNTLVPVDRAYTVGLFQDCGVLLLAVQAPQYRATWQRTRWLPDAAAIEQDELGVDHATLGASLVKHWGFAHEIAQAVMFHHDIERFDSLQVSARPGTLIALSALANFVLAQALSPHASLWEASFDKASAALNVPTLVARTWAEQAGSLL